MDEAERVERAAGLGRVARTVCAVVTDLHRYLLR